MFAKASGLETVNATYCARSGQQQHVSSASVAFDPRDYRDSRGLHEAGRQTTPGQGMEHALDIPTTYYLLRTADADAGCHAYVGLAPRGAHAIVVQASQARRFASIEAARTYAGTTGRDTADFEIEARHAD